MSFNLKDYKWLKIKYYFKKVNFFFFFHNIALDNENWIKVEQAFFNYKLEYYRVFNSLILNVLKISIFRNLSTLIHGPIILLNSKIDKLTLKKINDNAVIINLLCLKLNNKIYSSKQVKNLIEFSYKKNIYLFYKLLNCFVKKSYFTFKNISTKSISK